MKKKIKYIVLVIVFCLAAAGIGMLCIKWTGTTERLSTGQVNGKADGVADTQEEGNGGGEERTQDDGKEAREGVIQDSKEETGEESTQDGSEKPRSDGIGQEEERADMQTGIGLSILHTDGKTLAERIAPPQGYGRVACRKGSFGQFLRDYPLKKHGSPVLLYDGGEKGNQGAHVAVFKLPIEKEDLQQCADSVMRMYAEYFWKTGQKERICFHFVDGFLADYIRWRDGGRIQPGNPTVWVQSASYDDSYRNFKKFMRMVFAYAGTLSMEEEAKPVSLKKIKAGDIFIKGASPGHVVMVVDVCKNEEGKKAFLLAQGYMPAQEFHLLKNPLHKEDLWYYENEINYPLQTPEYSFAKGSLRRLPY